MNFPKLNLPHAELRFTKTNTGNTSVFDIVRKKFVDLTPEEWVRQHLIHYLTNHKQMPLSMLAVEKQLVLNGTKNEQIL